MSYVITIIVFILIFSALVLIHELGHFLMAKRAGIKVEEFGMGLPPRIWGKKKGETIYSVNWIPFGGFVRMYGEMSNSKSVLKSKRSFVGQSVRSRVLVIIAGVVMNFLLAWILMIVGFSFGMQPLLGPEDILTAVNDEIILLEEGVKIKDVEEGGFAFELGLKTDDVIISLNDSGFNILSVNDLLYEPYKKYSLIRDGELFQFELNEEQIASFSEEEGLGVEFYNFVAFPRVKIYSLSETSDYYNFGLREGDVIISVNGEEIFGVSEFEEHVRGVSNSEFEIYRDGLRETVMVELAPSREVIISKVIPDGPAGMAGIESGDVIVSVNGRTYSDSLELIDFIGEHDDEVLAFLITRGSERIFYEIKPVDGKVGILLSELISFGKEHGLSLYNVDQISSVLEIKDVKYPVYSAPYYALGETYRLSKLTVSMFGSFIVTFVSSGDVPDSIAGPVGIAQLTHVFIQDGLIAILRFIAVLSLSLAVLNILPFPALDGGRLLFMVVEVVLGKRVNQNWESMVHAIGYVLILLLLLVVTYSDIARVLGF